MQVLERQRIISPRTPSGDVGKDQSTRISDLRRPSFLRSRSSLLARTGDNVAGVRGAGSTGVPSEDGSLPTHGGSTGGPPDRGAYTGNEFESDYERGRREAREGLHTLLNSCEVGSPRQRGIVNRIRQEQAASALMQMIGQEKQYSEEYVITAAQELKAVEDEYDQMVSEPEGDEYKGGFDDFGIVVKPLYRKYVLDSSVVTSRLKMAETTQDIANVQAVVSSDIASDVISDLFRFYQGDTSISPIDLFPEGPFRFTVPIKSIQAIRRHTPPQDISSVEGLITAYGFNIASDMLLRTHQIPIEHDRDNNVEVQTVGLKLGNSLQAVLIKQIGVEDQTTITFYKPGNADHALEPLCMYQYNQGSPIARVDYDDETGERIHDLLDTEEEVEGAIKLVKHRNTVGGVAVGAREMIELRELLQGGTPFNIAASAA